MYAVLALPIPTISHASDAKRDGGFGLVGTGFTNPYHAADLGQGLPCVTFTNTYHRGEDTTHSGLDYVLCGVITIVRMWR